MTYIRMDPTHQLDFDSSFFFDQTMNDFNRFSEYKNNFDFKEKQYLGNYLENISNQFIFLLQFKTECTRK